MVNFKERLAGKKAAKPTDPVKLYETLDRAHDKGPLRPAQLAVLTEWFSKRQDTRDVIVKLHTGQGKTLIGLRSAISGHSDWQTRRVIRQEAPLPLSVHARGIRMEIADRAKRAEFNPFECHVER